MELFVDGRLNAQVFDMDVRRATHDLGDVLLAAVNTDSASIESTHFLMVLARVGGGATQKGLTRLGVTPEQWESGLSGCAEKRADSLPPAHLAEASLHPSAVAMLGAARARCAGNEWPRITEPVLLESALQHVTTAVTDLFRSVDIDLEHWRTTIEQDYLAPVVPVTVYGPSDALVTEAFAPGARRVLSLLQTEAESLGYRIADSRHLLLALLEREGGATHYALFQQGLAPKKIQAAVVLNLRGRAHRTRSSVPMDRQHHQPMLQRILERAGETAGRDRVPRVFEPHLLRAILGVENAAHRLLVDEGVNLDVLRASADVYELPADEDDEDVSMADIETVRRRLQSRIVGQDDAIARILPYVQRMRFGFSTPGRPVGVFLFCGQSGSGKTEMSKALAQAVYGSDENLVFLEMSLFNAPESMNIFVGAPPGYIGYGEGKLTNGLRDKPRAVVLFDEVEKAHAKVLDALLRFLDEGKIDDPAGPVRDGSQCIVILTSNVGAEELVQLWNEVKDRPGWRSVVRLKLREMFRRHRFRPEFLNRVDELVLFRPLTAADYSEVARRLLARDLQRLQTERQIGVTVDPGVYQAIGKYCSGIGEGARAAQRLTQWVVITPVIDFVLRTGRVPPIELRVRAETPDGDEASEPTGNVELA